LGLAEVACRTMAYLTSFERKDIMVEKNACMRKTHPVQLTTFKADITPPIGEPICGGLCPPVASIEHPLFAKGVILRDSRGIYVLCALDWASVSHASYDLFRREIAVAGGTHPSRVALQCVHQHTAISLDRSAQDLLDKAPRQPCMESRTFPKEALRRITAAVRQAVTRWQPVTHVGTGWAPVNQVASNRRILQPDGTILIRYSAVNVKDTARHAAPEGLIDGYLRTVSFYHAATPLVNMHYYATHPQSYYFDGRVSYDVPGIARERLEKETGAFQVYFNGCGGNIAMGKYNDGTPACRKALAERLYSGMSASLAATKRIPIPETHPPLGWKAVPFRFPLRRDKLFSASACRSVLKDAKASMADSRRAAQNLACINRSKAHQYPEISCLALGNIRMIHLPGEPFIEYQLWAQCAHPDLFIAMAGYGDCSMFYIGTDDAYAEKGGYELSWSFNDPCEKILKRAISQALCAHGGNSRCGARPARVGKRKGS